MPTGEMLDASPTLGVVTGTTRALSTEEMIEEGAGIGTRQAMAIEITTADAVDPVVAAGATTAGAGAGVPTIGGDKAAMIPAMDTDPSATIIRMSGGPPATRR